MKEGNKKRKNKQKNKKNSSQNEITNNEEKNQNIEIIISNQEEDKVEILSDKGTISTKEEENKEEIIKEEIKEEIINDNNNEENKKYKKKNKSEYEHSSSWQKNKFNMGLKIKKIKKENANIIIPKKYNQQEWSHKHQRYNNKEEIININNNSEIEENNYLIGSNMPQFTSFNFQSKKRKNYRICCNIFLLLLTFIVLSIISLLN